MPSPFPGMDPFIEGDEWPDFHVLFIGEIRRTVTPLLPLGYVMRAERHLWVRRGDDSEERRIRPDTFIARETTASPYNSGASGSVSTLAPPVVATLPQLVTDRPAYLEIRRAQTRDVVTVIELLSPANKDPGGGRWEYLVKRQAIHESVVHLVEIDLLRGGERLPIQEALPAADYYVYLSRAEERPACGVWPVSLREPLPTIPIPLANGDPDIPLDVQAIFGRVYDAAGYAYSLDYTRDPDPPLPADDLAWARRCLTAAEVASSPQDGP